MRIKYPCFTIKSVEIHSYIHSFYAFQPQLFLPFLPGEISNSNSNNKSKCRAKKERVSGSNRTIGCCLLYLFHVYSSLQVICYTRIPTSSTSNYHGQCRQIKNKKQRKMATSFGQRGCGVWKWKKFFLTVHFTSIFTRKPQRNWSKVAVESVLVNWHTIERQESFIRLDTNPPLAMKNVLAGLSPKPSKQPALQSILFNSALFPLIYILTLFTLVSVKRRKMVAKDQSLAREFSALYFCYAIVLRRIFLDAKWEIPSFSVTATTKTIIALVTAKHHPRRTLNRDIKAN